MLILIWFYATLVVSELLSLFNLFNAINIRVFTFFIIIGLILGFRRNLNFKKIPKINAYIWGTAFYTGCAFIAGLFIAPNNSDSMTYHFPRYLHWLRNQNLDYFYTSNSRQNFSPVLPDILFAQFHTFFLGDRFLFVPVWISTVATSFYIYKILMLINGNMRIAYISGFLSLIIPSQLAFMSSSQTDPISTFLVTALLYYAVLFQFSKNRSVFYRMIFMIPLFLTAKTTGLILSFPIYLFIFFKYNKILIKDLRKYLIFFILITIPSLPFIYRFWELGSDEVRGVFVSNPTVFGFVVNLWRIFLSNLQTPVPVVNDLLVQIFYWVTHNLGLVSNPVGYSHYGEFSLTSSLHGDSVGNPLHLILLIIAIFYFWKSEKYKTLTYLIFSQFLLIGALIGWQPWINRFTSTILVLGSILIGMWLGTWQKTPRRVLIGVLVAYSAFWVFFNPTRALVNPKPLTLVAKSLGVDSNYLTKIRHDFALPRERQYFSVRPELEKSYIQFSNLTRSNKISKVYIKIKGDDFEYPLWALTDFNVSIEHFNETDLYNINKSHVYLLCTQSCEHYGLQQVFMDKNLSLWK